MNKRRWKVDIESKRVETGQQKKEGGEEKGKKSR